MIDLRTVPQDLFIPILEGNLRRLTTRHKAYHHFVEAALVHLQGEAAWLYRGSEIDEKWVQGDPSLVDLELTERWANAAPGEPRRLPESVLLSRVQVHGRLEGVVGVARRGEFKMGKGRRLARLAGVLGTDLERRREERLTRVLARIRDKVISQLSPKDLAYQILDGLHQLVRYDHSAALLTWDEESGVMRVAAEKIVWTKAKSAFIGYEVTAEPELREALGQASGVKILSRDEADRPLRSLLDYYRGQGIPGVRDLLCAPLFFDDQLLGVLKIADYKGRPFDAYDVEVVERFLPAAALALRNVQVKQALEDQAMQAEIRAGLATLSRAVAHDVNNAVGTILPLGEQVRQDLREGCQETERLVADLDLIIEKAAVCKRIFSAMLRVGGRRAGGGPVDLHQVGHEMLNILDTHSTACGVRLELDLASDLPPVRISRQHLERVLWNLVMNAIEAMSSQGGTVTLRGRAGRPGSVDLSVVDDGPGMDEELLARIQEPFFTTKSNGTGLGLALVRSLVWQNDGALYIASQPGQGTEVRLELVADTGVGEGAEG